MSKVTESVADTLWSSDAGFRALLLEAERRHIPVRALGALGIAILGEGAEEVRLCGSITGRTSHLAVRLAANKIATKRLLADAGIPTPEGEAFDDMVEARAYFRCTGKPVVLKPVAGNLGRGVCTGIADDTSFVTAWREATRISRRVLVETMVFGCDVRVLVVNGRAVAATERLPPCAVGDGRASVAELIEQMNLSAQRGAAHETKQTRVQTDLEVLHTIGVAGYSLQSILPEGLELKLRCAANMSSGAESIDRTEDLHPSLAEMAVSAARILGLDIAGIDIVAAGIDQPWAKGDAQVIEVNATPGLRMHLSPCRGRPRPVHEVVLDYLFPGSGMPRRQRSTHAKCHA